MGISGFPWIGTGGYTYLHRDVPILLLPTSKRLSQSATSINAILHYGPLEDIPAGFTPQGYWNGVCVYQRPGTCAAISEEYEISLWHVQTSNF